MWRYPQQIKAAAHVCFKQSPRCGSWTHHLIFCMMAINLSIPIPYKAYEIFEIYKVNWLNPSWLECIFEYEGLCQHVCVRKTTLGPNNGDIVTRKEPYEQPLGALVSASIHMKHLQNEMNKTHEQAQPACAKTLIKNMAPRYSYLFRAKEKVCHLQRRIPL